MPLFMLSPSRANFCSFCRLVVGAAARRNAIFHGGLLKFAPRTNARDVVCVLCAQYSSGR